MARKGSLDDGQALVEFALVLPVFLLLLFGLVESGVLLNAASTVNHVSRIAALMAAEGGKTDGTDCQVLRAVERELTPPTSPSRVTSVEIYWSDANGNQIGGAVNHYDRSGSTTCTYGDGSTLTMPYALTTANYPESDRCDALDGCDPLHTSVDTIGVRITYVHQWVTMFGKFIGPSFTFQRSTAVREEPTL
jgi:hypothetical protein